MPSTGVHIAVNTMPVTSASFSFRTIGITMNTCRVIRSVKANDMTKIVVIGVIAMKDTEEGIRIMALRIMAVDMIARESVSI